MLHCPLWSSVLKTSSSESPTIICNLDVTNSLIAHLTTRAITYPLLLCNSGVDDARDPLAALHCQQLLVRGTTARFPCFTMLPGPVFVCPASSLQHSLLLRTTGHVWCIKRLWGSSSVKPVLRQIGGEDQSCLNAVWYRKSHLVTVDTSLPAHL